MTEKSNGKKPAADVAVAEPEQLTTPYRDLITAAGVPWREIGNRLAVPFENPEKAYKAIESGRGSAAGLTDISTGFLIERITDVFGLRGIGWDLEYDPEDLEFIGNISDRDTVGWLKKAAFVYYLFNKAGELEKTVKIQTDGISRNAPEYCLEGARTKAIGQAIKWFEFQLHIYKDMIKPLPEKGGQKSAASKTTAAKPDAKQQTVKSGSKQQPASKEKPAEKPAETNPDKQPEGGEQTELKFSIENYSRAAMYKIPKGLPNESLTLGAAIARDNGRIVLEYLAGLKPSPDSGVFYNAEENYDEKLALASKYVMTYNAQYKEAIKAKK